MSYKAVVIAISLFCGLLSCSTPKALDDWALGNTKQIHLNETGKVGLMGSSEEKDLGNNIWTVQVVSHGAFTTQVRQIMITKMRMAALTREQGFLYFTILELKDQKRCKYLVTGGSKRPIGGGHKITLKAQMGNSGKINARDFYAANIKEAQIGDPPLAKKRSLRFGAITSC